MAATVESIEISRRPEDVFTYVLEPLYYPEWDFSVVSAHREDPSPLTVGRRPRCCIGWAPGRCRRPKRSLS